MSGTALVTSARNATAGIPPWQRRGNCCGSTLTSLRKTFPILDMTMWDDQHVGHSVGHVREKCNGRDSAVAAARKLLREHADKFAENISDLRHDDVGRPACRAQRWSRPREMQRQGFRRGSGEETAAGAR